MKTYEQYEGLVVNEDCEQIEGKDSQFAIIFHLDDEKLHYLNETAYQIFMMCCIPQSREDIHVWFSKNYELEPDDVSSIDDCIEHLVSINVLEEKE